MAMEHATQLKLDPDKFQVGKAIISNNAKLIQAQLAELEKIPEKATKIANTPELARNPAKPNLPPMMLLLISAKPNGI